MDKSASWWAFLSAFGIFIVLGTSIPGTLFSMFILGMIPGTTHTLPLWVVMAFYPVIAWTALAWIIKQSIYIGEIKKPVKEPLILKTSRVSKKKTTLKQPALERRSRIAA